MLYHSSFLGVLHFNVVFLLCRSSLIFDTFFSVLVYNPDLFFLYQFMNFEQRYTNVPFIHYNIENENGECVKETTTRQKRRTTAKGDQCVFNTKNLIIKNLKRLEISFNDLTFPIVNRQFIFSNMHDAPSYIVKVNHLIRYSMH